MSIAFYYGSGSPFAWKVWLVLEHKRLAYDLHILSFQAGDTRTPEFRALNPRGKVPALVEGDVVLYESNAIVEYLEDAYPEPAVLPGNPGARALARRIAAEGELYLYAPVRALMGQTVMRPNGDGDPQVIDQATSGLVAELTRFEGYASRTYLTGNTITLADFALYPVLASIQRINVRSPKHAVAIPTRLARWMTRMETLPYFEHTYPPHWKA
jgi:glutathione S-transferase